MNDSSASEQSIVVLIGNYPLDRQESMLRFRNLVQSQLVAAGFTVESVFPRGYFGLIVRKGPLSKWFGYIDKYILFPLGLARSLSRFRQKYANRKIVVHICDHSNSVYASFAKRWFPVLVTCHDLLAVRGALGEETDCPASGFGKLLQKAILTGLGRATAVACVSRATQSDLIRLSGPDMANRSQVVPLALNYPYRALPREEALGVLSRGGIDLSYQGFVLHVGSSLRRKNREALLLSVARIKDSWPGKIVFAGDRLLNEEHALARSLGLEDRVVEIYRPDNETLLALYSAALGFIFMSRFEGFGWPILEAQVCACPVICSNRTSVPEVAGEGALIHEPDDYAAVAADIQHLQEPAFRDKVVALGRENVEAYSIGRMMGSYKEIYRRI